MAVLEDAILTEFYLERNQRRSLVGNIYKGRVTQSAARDAGGFRRHWPGKGRGFFTFPDFRDEVEALGFDGRGDRRGRRRDGAGR